MAWHGKKWENDVLSRAPQAHILVGEKIFKPENADLVACKSYGGKYTTHSDRYLYYKKGLWIHVYVPQSGIDVTSTKVEILEPFVVSQTLFWWGMEDKIQRLGLPVLEEI